MQLNKIEKAGPEPAFIFMQAANCLHSNHMDEPFILTVPYKGKNLDFDAQLQITGYTHRFQVMVNETEVFFEKDDEGEYRALVYTADDQPTPHLDRDLLQAIAEKIVAILA